MFTFIVIVVVVIVIVKACKPDKHDVVQDKIAISQLPSFTIRGKTLSKAEQFGELLLDEHVIREFSFSNGDITILYKDNGVFKANLSNMEVGFSYNMHRRIAELVSGRQRKWIQEVPGMVSAHDWDRIFYVLTLANKTYGSYNVSKAGMEFVDGANNAKMVMKVIKFLSE